MFSNISEKIKETATRVAKIMIALSVIGAIGMFAMMIDSEEPTLFAILMVVFILLALVGVAWAQLIYGYGVLIEKVCSIEKNVKISTLLKVDPKKPEAKQEKIKFLFDEGLISVDEYLTDDTK